MNGIRRGNLGMTVNAGKYKGNWLDAGMMTHSKVAILFHPSKTQWVVAMDKQNQPSLLCMSLNSLQDKEAATDGKEVMPKMAADASAMTPANK